MLIFKPSCIESGANVYYGHMELF